MLFGRAASVAKLLDFQQKSPSLLLVPPGGDSNNDNPRKEYLIDDSDLVGAVSSPVLSL
jgi:hypothetical protein